VLDPYFTAIPDSDLGIGLRICPNPQRRVLFVFIIGLNLSYRILPMSRRRIRRPKTIALIFLIALPFLWYGSLALQRPPRTPLTTQLFPGARYQRIIWTQPRPVILHAVAIDLRQPGLQILSTPGNRAKPDTEERELTALTTTEFLSKYGMDLAINAGYFFPFTENSPWDYYPHSGDGVNVVGHAISNGKVFSDEDDPTWRVLCFDGENQAKILNQSTCPIGTQQGLAGNELILQKGKFLNSNNAADGTKSYPRVVVGLNVTGDTLWLVLVDGKQRGYSEGASIAELAEFLPTLGITDALNLDGGGSTTLATKNAQGTKPLNAPIQNHIPMNERPVANHLGFRFSQALSQAQ
jgi:Phosphodiester glycosidase